MLVRSGLTPELAEARGYRTITADQLNELAELEPTPFGRTSRHPGLLVPSHGVNGRVVGHQLRPDSEVVASNGSIKKYVTPFGEAAMLDCPPTMRGQLQDVSTPLLITEGAKKADAAAARGLLCLALRGVDNWTTSHGTALEEWRDIPLGGRRIGIAYDSDIADNQDVKRAAKRLAKYLTKSRGATVDFIVLPPADDGSKNGLDDWLVANSGADPWDLAHAGLDKSHADQLDDAKTLVPATDLHIADEWVAYADGRYRYLSDEKNWLSYKDGMWDANSGIAIACASFQDFIREVQAFSVITPRNGEPPRRKDETPWLYSASRIPAVLSHASANRLIQITSDQLDPDPYLFNVANGTLNLRDGKLYPHDLTDLITMRSPVAYDPNTADYTEFEKFLRTVLPDEETRLFVQRLLGQAMIGEVVEHVFPVFLGTGRNGKGTLLRLVQGVFGSYYTGISKNLLIETKFEGHATIRTSLFRRRLVTAEEVAENAAWNAASINDLTGGGDITGNRMRENEITFKPSHTLILAANHWPRVSAKDEAFWARVKKIPFNVVFARPDSTIEKRIRENEQAGILRWLLEGCQDYLRTGSLGEPTSVVAATAGIRAESNPLHNFLDDHVEVTHNGDDLVVLSTLYDLYTSWCRSQMPRMAEIPKKTFGTEAAKAAGLEPPVKIGRDKITVFRGMRLNDGQTVTESNNSPVSPLPEDPNRDLGDKSAVESALVRMILETPEADISGDGPILASSRSCGLNEPQCGPTGGLIPLEESAGQSMSADLADLTDSLLGGSSLLPGTTCKPVNLKTGKQENSFFSPELEEEGGDHENRSARSAFDFSSPDSGPSSPYTATDLETFVQDADVDLPDGVVVFDIESTGSSLWPTRPDFIRITGVQRGKTIRVFADAAEVAELLNGARLIVGHNIMGFDLLAFALHHGVDLHHLTAEGRVIDTMLTEILINPPEARTKQGQIMRANKLDALGQRKFGVGKTDDLAKLAKEFGGFDKIPVDEERYVSYCAGDVNLTARLAQSQKRTAYIKREHQVAALAAQMRINGFRVDLDLLAERLVAGRTKRAELTERLVDRYGLLTTDAKGKAYKAPHATAAGKKAIEQAFVDLGVTLSRTASSGEPALGKEALAEVAARHAADEAVMDLIETVGSLNGIRSVYETIERCRVGDRVHPDITMFQASGRWSIIEPGLTVMGKRGGKYVEREVFLPEPGHVVIAADLAQVDARAVAAWCQDPAYLELFEPGRDSHTEIALAVWNDVSRRDDAKIIGHGWNYGMGIPKLAVKCGSEDAAREFDRAMRDRFPGLVEWKRQTAAFADSGQLLNNGFGRLLRTTPGYGWTQGPALLGQSAARDIIMRGLLCLQRHLHPYLRAVIHDEVVMSIPIEQADEIEAQVIEALQFSWAPPGARRQVRIEAGLAKRGESWGACYASK